jgi:predicted anti-sigma-YlaC factor YlaD
MARPHACERARAWASARLDGELSELEGALLDAHLGRCPACSGAVSAIDALARSIREAPLEAVQVRPSLASARKQGSLRAFYAAAASTVAVVGVLTSAGFVGAVHLVAQSAPQPELRHVSAVAGGAMSDELQLSGHVRVLRLERPVPGRVLWPA